MKEPKIRFKGFSGEWEETTFGNRLLSIQTGTNLLGSTDNKGIPLLKMGNIQRGYFSFDKLERLDESVTPAVNCIAKYGDFYYNTRNTLELVGKGATWMQKKGIFAFNSNIARCSLDGVNTIFFNYLYNTRNVIKQVQARAKGTTSVAAVYQRDLDSIEFSLPSVDEQKALGSFFQHLDSLIQSTTKKIESLKQVKAASLLSMFPQKGETTPRVRFKGFEGEWEKVTVSTLLEERREFEIMSDEYPLKAFIAYVGVSDKGERYDRSSLVNDVENKVYKKTELGDFIYSSNNLETGSIGLNRYGKATISPVYSIFKCTEKSYSGYIGCAFTCKDFINKMVKWRQGVMYGQWRIHELDFLKIDIFVPSFDEQRCIGNYFTTLDRQITLQTQRLEKLKQIKAACLDNMFV